MYSVPYVTMDLQRITFRLKCTAAPLAGVAASYGWGPITITTENIHDFAGYACQDVALLNLLAASYPHVLQG